jgi:non-specific serine/threonine protein kinase
MDAAAFAEAWEAGRSLTLEAAIAEALAGAAGGALAATGLPTDGPERLTAREAEIAGLMARGLTNRQLAAELAISERTVERHLTTIRAKLGVSGRVQVATWALARGLGAPMPQP